MKISEIKTAEPFQNLFPIDVEVLESIESDMERFGYDGSKPIDIWRGIVIDGHTRLFAAKEVGIDDVPVFEHDFESKDEAFSYAIHNQRDRRNITDADILRSVELMDRRKKSGDNGGNSNHKSNSAKSKSRGETAVRVAKAIGISKTKVYQARAVIDHADEEIKESVKSGNKSINKAYNETQKKRKQEKVVKCKSKPKFNATNENIDWAKWSWNPVTGCLHDCTYCYARDIANRFYPEKFKPTFRPERLSAPQNTKIPNSRKNEPGIHNVFTVSMGDLFGDWVPQEWIEAVLKVVRESPQWNFLFLTKNPKRYVGIDFPDNAWVGTTVDIQARVSSAEEAFKQVKARVKFLSIEPFLEKLVFRSLKMFDWIIVGGRSKSTKLPAMQPKWKWVEELLSQAREADCKVYFKPNLEVRPKEYPGGQ